MKRKIQKYKVQKLKSETQRISGRIHDPDGDAAELERNPEAHSGGKPGDTCGTHTGAGAHGHTCILQTQSPGLSGIERWVM